MVITSELRALVEVCARRVDIPISVRTMTGTNRELILRRFCIVSQRTAPDGELATRFRIGIRSSASPGTQELGQPGHRLNDRIDRYLECRWMTSQVSAT